MIGVLGLQGGFDLHLNILNTLNVSCKKVRSSDDLTGLNGLIIPGGESTTIRHLLQLKNMWDLLLNKASQGMPIFGTCAGSILLGHSTDPTEKTFGLMDYSVERNAYGTQRESFQAQIDVLLDKKEVIDGVFIRAPKIHSAGDSVEVLASYAESPVVVRQGNHFSSTFHPEVTGDVRMHRYILQAWKAI